MPRDTRLTGDAGAFLVGAELAQRGWPAALTTAGTTRTDFLAQVGEEHLAAAIQVKTKSARSKDFQPGGVVHGAAPQANEWVVMVALSEDRQHRFYVMPRDVVVATVQALKLAYNNPSRVMLNENEFKDYADEWDLLEHPSWEVPWRLRGWVYDYRHEMAWPEGHRGVPEDCVVRRDEP
jgi:hypothetical protein